MLELALANRFDALADKALAGEQLALAEALSVLATDDEQLLSLCSRPPSASAARTSDAR